MALHYELGLSHESLTFRDQSYLRQHAKAQRRLNASADVLL